MWIVVASENADDPNLKSVTTRIGGTSELGLEIISATILNDELTLNFRAIANARCTVSVELERTVDPHGVSF